MLAVVPHLLAFDDDLGPGAVVGGALYDDLVVVLPVAAGAWQRQLDEQVGDDAGRLAQRDRGVVIAAAHQHSSLA